MVDKFCADNDYDLNLTVGRCKSWWIAKKA
jgi:hypothetical protein